MRNISDDLNVQHSNCICMHVYVCMCVCVYIYIYRIGIIDIYIYIGIILESQTIVERADQQGESLTVKEIPSTEPTA